MVWHWEQDWDAEFVDEEEDTLAEEFGSALDETIRDRLARAGLDSAEARISKTP